MTYQPPSQYLERYGDLLVNYALAGGAGIRPGEVVCVRGPESAKPLFAEVCRAVWRSGGHVLQDFRPDTDASANLVADFVALASPEQLAWFPEQYYRGQVDQVDHLAYIACEADPHALAGVDAAKLMARKRSFAPLVQWEDEKENAGRFSWTIGLYPTAAMAAEARLSLEEYWGEVILACFLDDADPKRRWREVKDQVDAFSAGLNALPVDRLHVHGPDADLWLTLGERRRWVGGSGRNIPSFECYTSPDWRGTEGWIRFSEPLYTHGSLITGIELTFAGGRVTRATANENESLLREMIASEGADRIGEYSLTDARLSRITKFMANTLYDENVGGPHGNTHLAIGRSYANCYDGDPATMTQQDWERLGFNDSVVHTDIVSTTEREVTAVLHDGSRRTIYAGGQFQLDP
jgi:aminopeptidase